MSNPLLPCLLAALALPSSAQEAVERVAAKLPAQPAAQARPIAGQGFALEAGEMAVEDLIDAAAQFLNRNILFTPMELQAAGGKAGVPAIRLQSRIELDALGCEEVLTSLLHARGFALTPLDPGRNLYEVIFMAGPRAREIFNRAVVMTPEELQRRPMLKVAVQTTVELKHASANFVANALRPFANNNNNHPSGGVVLSSNNTRTILILGFADQVAAAVRMARECDKAAPADQPPDLLVRVQQLEQQIQSLNQQLARKADKPEKQ